MDYWGIGNIYLEPCCSQRYYEQMEYLGWDLEAIDDDESFGRLRRVLWDLFDNPSSSIWAKLVAAFSMVGVVTTVAVRAFYTIENSYFDDLGGSVSKSVFDSILDNVIAIQHVRIGQLSGHDLLLPF